MRCGRCGFVADLRCSVVKGLPIESIAGLAKQGQAEAALR